MQWRTCACLKFSTLIHLLSGHLETRQCLYFRIICSLGHPMVSYNYEIESLHATKRVSLPLHHKQFVPNIKTSLSLLEVVAISVGRLLLFFFSCIGNVYHDFTCNWHSFVKATCSDGAWYTDVPLSEGPDRRHLTALYTNMQHTLL